MYEKPLASMGVRLGAYVIDELIVGAVVGVVSAIAFFILGLGTMVTGFGDVAYGVNVAAWIFSLFGTILSVVLLPVMFHFLYAYMMYKTNGLTPGKKLLGIRAVRLDGQPFSFGDAVIREVLLKSFANGFTSGLLNLGSFIWGCCTPERKTVHDLAANTTVVEDRGMIM